MQTPKHKEAGKNIFMSSMVGLANVLAVIITFICAPLLYNKTEPWMQNYVYVQYGAGLSDLVSFIWFIITILLIFFVSRASVATALIMGAMAFAMRLL